MKVTLYNAVSLDGFIARPDGDSDWALDDKEFEAFVSMIGCILIGRKTFEQFTPNIYPMSEATNFIYTANADGYEPQSSKFVKFISGSPVEVINALAQQGFENVVLGGGGQTNGSFAEAGLIDEMILDVHPLLLGEGIRLLGDCKKPLELELISSTKNEKGFLQNHYKVIKI